MSVDMTKWFSRKFPYAPPAGEFPMIVERLRGTPARVEARVAETPPELLTRKIGDVWSVQENIGHLTDLEPLWTGRLQELIDGVEVLSEADLTNQKTYDADHNARAIADVVADFRRVREDFVRSLDALTNDQILRTALHPRLRQPMRTIDLCLFVAEHDDHHLTMITQLLRTLTR